MNGAGVAIALVLGGSGCDGRTARAALPEADRRAGPSAPADSLVTTTADGTEIWFTLARGDSGATGRCIDRAIEIRRDGRRIPVPLLYTGTSPALVDDTTLRARRSAHCAPGDAYLVDLRTGRPVRDR